MSNTDTTLSNRVSQLDELHLLAIVDCRISGINCCRAKKFSGAFGDYYEVVSCHGVRYLPRLPIVVRTFATKTTKDHSLSVA